MKRIPNVGFYDPPGWREDMDLRFFVDKTGADNSGPAQTINTFIAHARALVLATSEPLGFAIVEEGPFQLYIGVFREV